MKFLIPILFLTISLSAQESVNVYYEQVGMGVNIYADNNEVIPMTIELKLTLTGMESDIANDEGYIVVPAKSKKFLIAGTKVSPNSREMTFAMDSKFYIGDITLKPHSDHIYKLPFSKLEEVQVYQGYNGSFSHAGENAIDFGLEIGDKVTASRSGVVYQVVDSNSKACQDESCAKYNNLVTIYHEDGTFAEYVHLKKDGAKVNIGDKVAAGDLIGYSGNTGWTSGPHLHYMVFQYTKKGTRISYKTKFSTEAKKEGEYLREKKFYKMK